MDRIERIRRNKKGTTLVELMVSLMLLSILMAMVVGVVSPAAKTFARMQRVQFAQLILDNLEDEIKSRLLDATGILKIYGEENTGIVGETGADKGTVLEYQNTNSYVVLMSADGCVNTTLVTGGQTSGTEKADSGRLLLRYYWQEEIASEHSPYKYYYTDGVTPVARAVQQVFTNGFYMGNYLKIYFAFPDGITEGQEAEYLNITLELYRDSARTDLLAKEEFTADLRYKAKRTDKVTALVKPAAP